MGEDDDKKFSNKNTFMVSNPPQWWNKHNAQKRMDWNVKNTNKFFSMHFAGMKAEDNLKPLFEDLLEDAARIKTECSQLGNRKRRAFTADEEEGQEESTADEGDPMTATSASDGTRKVTGDIKADAKKYTLNVARWIKYEVYDLGGNASSLASECLSVLIVFDSTFTTPTANRLTLTKTSATGSGPSTTAFTHVLMASQAKSTPDQADLWNLC